MEDIRTYRNEEEELRRIAEERIELSAAAAAEDEVPFHIPRD